MSKLAKAAFPGFFFTLAGFVLFLLITLSTPIIKQIYFLKVQYPSGASAYNMGTFGLCGYINGESCSDRRVGYSVLAGVDPNGVIVFSTFNAGFGGVGQVLFGDGTIMWRALSGALILNAIAAGLAGISMLTALFAWICSIRAFEIITFITLLGATFVAFVAFWVDLAFVLVGRNRTSDYTNGAFSGHIGPAFWMALGGLIALMLALCFVGCGMFGKYKEKKERRSSFDREEKLAGTGARKPWQRRAAPVAPVAAAPMAQNNASAYPTTTNVNGHHVVVHPVDPATGTYAATVTPQQQRY